MTVCALRRTVARGRHQSPPWDSTAPPLGRLTVGLRGKNATYQAGKMYYRFEVLWTRWQIPVSVLERKETIVCGRVYT